MKQLEDKMLEKLYEIKNESKHRRSSLRPSSKDSVQTLHEKRNTLKLIQAQILNMMEKQVQSTESINDSMFAGLESR